MSCDSVISIRSLAKTYYVYKRPIDRVLQSIFPERVRQHREVKALSGIDLDICKGETIGIIGRNGSGKSTLLQIISGTLYQTGGTVSKQGRLTALLELGAGFNPQFTGRENAYLNASIMGIPRSKLEQRFDDILEFSGIEGFIDQPVKTYSSGMFVRLAFSVAIHMDPDILIVDEALSVGDVGFQSKCFRKLRELKEGGTTTLFVTHATELIVRHCDRAVLLEKGNIVSLGEPMEVVNEYQNLLFGSDLKPTLAEASTPEDHATDQHGFFIDTTIDGCQLRKTYNSSEYRWGDRRGIIQDYVMLVNGESATGVCSTGDRIDVLVRAVFLEQVANPIYGLTIKTADGVTVYGANTKDRNVTVEPGGPGSVAMVRFSFTADLVTADYFISLGLADIDDLKESIAVDRRFDLIHLYISSDHLDFGIVSLNMDIDRIEVA
ncbi:MAG TPA: sugar ABC transporter ATP-binding protein [Gammaproteobacteria bacterium]|nr:sugar ABC transporter ATP-binding protein [Gammaproteobacteria bacterium]